MVKSSLLGCFLRKLLGFAAESTLPASCISYWNQTMV